MNNFVCSKPSEEKDVLSSEVVVNIDKKAAERNTDVLFKTERLEDEKLKKVSESIKIMAKSYNQKDRPNSIQEVSDSIIKEIEDIVDEKLKHKKLRIIVLGRTGANKSSLIKYLLEFESRDGSINKPYINTDDQRATDVTKISEVYNWPETDIELIDTPGFGSTEINASEFFSEKVFSHIGKEPIDIAIFLIREASLSDNDLIILSALIRMDIPIIFVNSRMDRHKNAAVMLDGVEEEDYAQLLKSEIGTVKAKILKTYKSCQKQLPVEPKFNKEGNLVYDNDKVIYEDIVYDEKGTLYTNAQVHYLSIKEDNGTEQIRNIILEKAKLYKQKLKEILTKRYIKCHINDFTNTYISNRESFIRQMIEIQKLADKEKSTLIKNIRLDTVRGIQEKVFTAFGIELAEDKKVKEGDIKPVIDWTTYCGVVRPILFYTPLFYLCEYFFDYIKKESAEKELKEQLDNFIKMEIPLATERMERYLLGKVGILQEKAQKKELEAPAIVMPPSSEISSRNQVEKQVQQDIKLTQNSGQTKQQTPSR